jgi:hypothetical protein
MQVSVMHGGQKELIDLRKLGNILTGDGAAASRY